MTRTVCRLLSATALLVFASGLRAADDDPKAILARGLKAHGGAEVTAKYTAARVTNKGKINLPGVGEVAFTQNLAYQHPGMLKDGLSLNVAGQEVNIVTVANGDKLTITANGQDIPVPESATKAIKDAQYMMKVARLVGITAEKGFELSLVGEVKVEDKPAIGVRVSSKDHKDISLFFSKETGLLVKVEHRTTAPGGDAEITEERIILEYQKGPEGMMVPKKVLVKHDGKTFLEADVEEFTPLEKIDESEFKK